MATTARRIAHASTARQWQRPLLPMLLPMLLLLQQQQLALAAKPAPPPSTPCPPHAPSCAYVTLITTEEYAAP
jgi:hypothetical protein